MFERALIAIIGLVLLCIIWVLIQLLWKKTFADEFHEEDVLSGRGDCSHCACDGGKCDRIDETGPKHKSD